MAERRWRAWIAGLLVGLGLAGGVRAEPPVLELRQADATVVVAGRASHAPRNLPYHWDRHHPRQGGSAMFTLRFALESVPRTAWGIYLPRLGNAYEVWLNGTLVQHQGDMVAGNGADYGQVPRFVYLAPGLLHLDNELRIAIRADVGRRGGLAPVWVGPEPAVAALYRSAHAWRVTGSMFVVGFSLLVGVVALALWATQVDPSHTGRPRRDPLYLYAGLAELFWSVRVGDVLIENPWLPWPWWGVVPVAALGAWSLTMGLLCMEVAGWSSRPGGRRLQEWLWLLALSSGGAAAWALGAGVPMALTVWYAAMGLTFIALGSVFVRQAFGPVSWTHRAVALAVVLNVLVGLRDLYVFRINPTYADSSLMRYSSVLFGLTLGLIVIVRFRRVSAQARELMQTLASRIEDRERELASSYQRLEAMAREQERSAERSRILRDMHDGVGSHISAAIRQLQSGRASSQELLATLRDSLDQLKLSIDAMNLPAGDVTTLLANLRYRLEPRLRAAGIELDWGVSMIAPIERLDAHALRHLQFIVLEALSNVLQHAGASALRIEAEPLGAGVRLRIADNGRGFDVDGPRRNGLMAMQDRARAIGADLELRSQPGHTVVELRL